MCEFLWPWLYLGIFRPIFFLFLWKMTFSNPLQYGKFHTLSKCCVKQFYLHAQTHKNRASTDQNHYWRLAHIIACSNFNVFLLWWWKFAHDQVLNMIWGSIILQFYQIHTDSHNMFETFDAKITLMWLLMKDFSRKLQ